MQKIITNNFRTGNNGNGRESQGEKLRFTYNESSISSDVLINLKTKLLAIGIFAFYFIQQGTVGLIPQKYLFIYRSVNFSDLILYSLIFYSLICYKEYKDLFNSKSLRIVKLIFLYFIFEFFVSYLRYNFDPIEYFFRVKGVWYPFLIFPFLLLIKRNGLTFFIKLIFPVAVISNILYIPTALTGTAFLDGVTIIRQQLPGGMEVYRVYGGTFFGELFFLGMVYYWITKRFKVWHLFPVVLFIIPHILAFGRIAWAYFVFTIIIMVVINSVKKKLFRILVRHTIILIVLLVAVVYGFLKFIPESDYYVSALESRLTQGQEDVTYSEGTYGTRTDLQNNALMRLWSKSNLFLGIGMHPMWVESPQSYEEYLYYIAFCDAGYMAVIAAYGLIGFLLAVIFQIQYTYVSLKLLRKITDGTINGFFITVLFAKLLFDTLICFSFVLVSFNLWGLSYVYLYIPFFVYVYEQNRKNELAVTEVNK